MAFSSRVAGLFKRGDPSGWNEAPNHPVDLKMGEGSYDKMGMLQEIR